MLQQRDTAYHLQKVRNGAQQLIFDLLAGGPCNGLDYSLHSLLRKSSFTFRQGAAGPDMGPWHHATLAPQYSTTVLSDGAGPCEINPPFLPLTTTN